MCQFCVLYSYIYNLYMYKHETIRNQLINYLTFISVNWNLEKTDRLTGYSVKVHNTNEHIYLYCKVMPEGMLQIYRIQTNQG